MDVVKHGGDTEGFVQRYGRPPIDFSASLNPLGIPNGMAEAARRAVDASGSYPDPLCRRLRAELAARLGVPAGAVFCGNGAADVIYRFALALRPRRALIPVPAFAEYEAALALAGCGMRFHRLPADNGFAPTRDLLGDITPDIDVVMLCQPNNPTGLTIPADLLSGIRERCRDAGALLFVDECFLPFVAGARRLSLVRAAGESGDLFVLGSFTKLFGSAGIRLGFGVSGNRELLRRLHGAGPPWSVSTAAQAAGLAALDEGEYVRRSLRLVRREKRRLIADLRRLGQTVIGAEANFIFFHSHIADLPDRLADAGIAIRDCGGFRGLEAGYFRIAVRRREENETLVRALENIVARD